MYIRFIHCTYTVHTFKIIKNGSHNIIHTFKNYFDIVFSVFSFSRNKFKINETLYYVEVVYLHLWKENPGVGFACYLVKIFLDFSLFLSFFAWRGLEEKNILGQLRLDYLGSTIESSFLECSKDDC